jgi:hypothetical protein
MNDELKFKLKKLNMLTSSHQVIHMFGACNIYVAAAGLWSTTQRQVFLFCGS